MYNTSESVRFAQSIALYEKTGFIVLLAEPDWYEGYEPEPEIDYYDEDIPTVICHFDNTECQKIYVACSECPRHPNFDDFDGEF